MNESKKETLLLIRNEIVREFENIEHWLGTGILTDRRRKDLKDYEAVLVRIRNRLKTGEYSPEVIREQIDEAKREFKI